MLQLMLKDRGLSFGTKYRNSKMVFTAAFDAGVVDIKQKNVSKVEPMSY